MWDSAARGEVLAEVWLLKTAIVVKSLLSEPCSGSRPPWHRRMRGVERECDQPSVRASRSVAWSSPTVGEALKRSGRHAP